MAGQLGQVLDTFSGHRLVDMYADLNLWKERPWVLVGASARTHARDPQSRCVLVLRKGL